jgi:hypothetical protein
MQQRLGIKSYGTVVPVPMNIVVLRCGSGSRKNITDPGSSGSEMNLKKNGTILPRFEKILTEKRSCYELLFNIYFFVL